MAVNVGQRNVDDTPQNRQLEACAKAQELALHTIKICSNKNIFIQEYNYYLTDEIVKTARDVYIHVWSANNVLVKEKRHWQYRSDLQERACIECNNLLALIGLARSLFHLKGNKVRYWSQLALDTRKLVRSWHEADVKRYRDVS